MAAACMLSRQRAPRRSWCRYLPRVKKTDVMGLHALRKLRATPPRLGCSTGQCGYKRCVGSITPPLWKRYEYSLPRDRARARALVRVGAGVGVRGLGLGLGARLARRPVDRVPEAALGVVLERSLQMVEADVVR